MQTVRFGIVGAGFVGRTHAESVARYIDGAELVAVAGGTRAPALAQEYGVACEASVEALMERRDIDAVIIATPHHLHAPETLLAAQAGKHVMVDKPMAISLDECDAMIDACRRAGVVLMAGQTQRFRVVNRTAKELVDEGRIGKVLMMRESQINTDGKAGLPAWQFEPQNGGLLLAHGVHNLDRMRWLAGSEPISVAARCTTYREDTTTELSSMALFTFASGAAGTIWCDWECPKPGFPNAGSSAWIMGEAGVLDLDAYGQLKLGKDGEWSVVAAQAPIDWRGKGMLDPVRMEAYKHQNGEFVAAIRDSRQPSVTGTDGRAAVEMALAAYASSDSGETVHLPLR